MQSPRYELNKNFFFFPNSNKEDTVDNDPRAFLMGMGHHIEANVWIHKAGQRQWRNSSNWLIDDIIWGEGKKKKKRKNKFACFFFNSIRPPRERKEKVGSLNQHCSSTKTTWLSREGTAGFHTSIFQPIREEVGIKSILQPTHCLCRAWTLLHLKQRKIKMPWTTEEQPASRGAFLYQ